MDVHTNIPLKNYVSMRLGGPARFMTDVSSAEDLQIACRNAKEQKLPLYILGGGSNTIVHDDGFNGLVVHNRIMGFEVLAKTPSGATIKIGAGEDWDETVKRTVEMNLTGIEAMSGIPGTVGAAPVQNIGAYGQELSDTLVELEAYDIQEDSMVTLSSEACGFTYRDSIFRGTSHGRYVITSITLLLSAVAPKPPFYAALQQYFDAQGITLYTAQAVRSAVLAIRADKLPDPKERPNTGSFFKNAIIEQWQLDELRKTWPEIPAYELGEKRYKVPTGWLIEQTGMKGKLLHGMRVHDKNALVLINESATGYADLAAAREAIVDAVRDTFRIVIEQEPLELRSQEEKS